MKCLPIPGGGREYHLDVCCATNGAHIEIYLAYKKLGEVQCLEMDQFFLYTSWLKRHIMFCFIAT
jgi:hypothetical protein